jgi:membrane protease YdiL (CAAX protease family)
MQDPTLLALCAAFLGAALLFSITALWRGASAEPQTGLVDTSIYRPQDLMGVGIIFGYYVLFALASLVEIEEADMEITASGLIISMVIQAVLPAVLICVVIKRVRVSEWLGLQWEKWPSVFIIGPAAALGMLMVLGLLESVGYTKWIKSLGVETVQDSVKLLRESPDPIVIGLMGFAAVIVAPFCEEIVFRGYLYPVMKKFSGPWIAGICSALIFAAAHGSMAALFPLFLFGGLLAYLYEKIGSIWVPIAVHLCFNATTVAVQLLDRATP